MSMRLFVALGVVFTVSSEPSGVAGLYGIANTGAALPGALITIDVSSGATQPVGGALGPEYLAQQLSALDITTQTYYVIGLNASSNAPNVVGISLATGNVVSSVPLGFGEEALVGVGQNIAWDPLSNSIVVSGENAMGDHLFGFIDPFSGQFSAKAQLNCTEPKCLPVLAGPAAYAPDSGIYLTQLGADNDIDFLAVNMSNGDVYATPDCNTVETLDYDSTSGSFFGIGLQLTPTVQRTLVKLSPDAKSCSVVGTIPNYVMIAGGMSALDSNAGVLYWISAPGGYPVNYTLNVYNLVGTSISDASTVSETPFCCFGGCTPPATQPDCPWSIEYNDNECGGGGCGSAASV